MSAAGDLTYWPPSEYTAIALTLSARTVRTEQPRVAATTNGTSIVTEDPTGIEIFVTYTVAPSTEHSTGAAQGWPLTRMPPTAVVMPTGTVALVSRRKDEAGSGLETF